MYSLNVLLNERYELNYTISERFGFGDNEDFNYSICIPLDQFNFKLSFLNETKIQLDQIETKVFEHLDTLIDYSGEIRKKVLNLKNGRNFYFFNFHFCIFSDNFINLLPYRLFYKKIKFFKFQKDEKDFFIKNHDNAELNIAKVHNKPYPYSDCSEIEPKTKKKYSKFNCINECFKDRDNSLLHSYESNENVSVNIEFKNDLNSEDKNFCLDKCNANQCRIVFDFEVEPDQVVETLIEAHPSISEFEFCSQLIGLICLIWNISVYQIFWPLIEKGFEMLNLNESKIELKILSFKIKFLVRIMIIFIFLVQVLFLYFKIYDDHLFKSEYPLERKFINVNVEPEPFHLVICISIEKNKLVKMTLSQLENETNDLLNETLEDIYLDMLNKKRSINLKPISKTILKTVYGHPKYKLERCHQIEVNLKEPPYQSLLSITKLIVKFKRESSHELFILPHLNYPFKSTFTEDSYRFNKYKNILKKVTKRSKLSKKRKCINYYEYYENCFSKSDCRTKCKTKKYVDKYLNFSFNTIIDKDEYTDYEWSNYYLTKYDFNFEKACKYEIEDCYSVYFEDDLNILPNSEFDQIDLYHKSQINTDDEQSIYKLILDLINIQSIFFGLNILNILKATLKSKLFKVNFELKKNKILKFIIYFLCFGGFTCHLYYALNKVLNDDLINNQFYEPIDSFEIPDVLFCFNINQTLINSNFRITGNYLENLNDDLNYDSIFEKVIYLNELNQWVDLDLNKKSILTVETLFLLEKKCFVFKNEREFELSQFYFRKNTEMLKIIFKESFIRSIGEFYFMTKIKKSMQFSKTLIFNRDYNYHLIDHGTYEIIYREKFNFIKNFFKNPLFLLDEQNDLKGTDKYLKRIINRLKNQYKFATLNFPLEVSNFDLDIDNDLFDQYYLQIQNKLDSKSNENLSFEKNYLINNLKNLQKSNNSGEHFGTKMFEFKVMLMRNRLLITNEQNYANLILNLLNLIVLWLNLDAFNILNAFFKLTKLILIFNYKFLSKIKLELLKMLKKLILNQQVSLELIVKSNEIG